MHGMIIVDVFPPPKKMALIKQGEIIKLCRELIKPCCKLKWRVKANPSQTGEKKYLKLIYLPFKMLFVLHAASPICHHRHQMKRPKLMGLLGTTDFMLDPYI